MDSISRSRRPLEAGSGGKIVRTRRPAAARARTPYDRPTPAAAPPNPPPQNPNWLSRLVFSPTRSIVSGAGKVLSAVFRSDSSSEYSSEDGSDDEEYDGDYISSQEYDGLKERNGTSETKTAIEQLIRQETFSREECDKLIKIIRSRVVGGTTTEGGEHTRPNIHTPDLSATAVSEAKKWLMEMRSGSASKGDLDHGTSVSFPQGDDDGVGSPVDVAKSYMRARPPWSSPSIPHGDLKSTSPQGLHLFSEGTKYPLGGSSVSVSKLKRDSPATGSWNIQDEIRKVRTKATEEMLKSLPSTRIGWSALSSQNRSTLTDDMGDKLKNLKKATGSTMSWSTTHGLEVSEKTQDGLHKETLPLPAVTSFEPNQVLDAAVSIGGNQGKEVNGSKSAYTTNGFPSSTHSLSAQLGTDRETNEVNTSHDKIVTHLLVEETSELQKTTETINDLSKDNENDAGTNKDDPMHLNQGNVEVQNANENEIGGTKYNDSAASGSQNSSSMPDELSQELTQPPRNLRSSPAAKDISVAEKSKATRPGRGHTRRGRSRGK